MSKLLIALLLVCQTAFAAPRQIELTPDNTIVLANMVNPFSLIALLSIIDTAHQALPAGEKLYLVIYTNGGLLDGCSEFSEAIEKYDNLEIVVLRARSAGARIAQCNKLKRVIDKDGDFMFHKVKVQISDILDAKQMQQVTDELKKASDQFDKECSTRLSIPLEEYDKNTDGKDWFVNAKDAVKIGAAEEEVEIKCSPALEKDSPQVLDIEPMSDRRPKAFCKVLKIIRDNKGAINGTKPVKK